MPRSLPAWLLTFTLCLLSLPAGGAMTLEAVVMEPAKTRVGLARVNLHVLDLHLADGETIVGTYEIKIPLAPWMNDRGAIRLRTPGPIGGFMTAGATISGSGHSELDGRTHPIVCQFGSDGTVDIHVATDERDLYFQTRYRIVER